MSAPFWILLPVVTLVGVIAMALAPQRLERNVLVSSQDGPAEVVLVEDHQEPWTRNGR
jgi:hypothetical protein